MKRFGAYRLRRTAWLQVGDSPLVQTGDTTWLERGFGVREGLDKAARSLTAVLLPVDDDGVPAEPVELAIESRGGGNTLHLLGYLGSTWRPTRSFAYGIHARLSIFETVTPFYEGEWISEEDRWRTGIGVSPWCLVEQLRPVLCRGLMFEGEIAASFDGGDYLNLTYGARVSFWKSDGLVGAVAIGLSAWVRGSADEVSAGVGAGFGLY